MREMFRSFIAFFSRNNPPTEQAVDSPLCDAARDGDLERVKKLLDAGANPDEAEQGGGTALMRAAGFGHPEVAKVLVTAKANPNAMDDNGWTALMYAGLIGDFEVIEVLTTAGANPNAAFKNGWGALLFAALANHSEATAALVFAGANPNAKEKGGWSVLMSAAAMGHSNVAQVLIDTGAELDMADENGMTALMLAARNGRSEVVKIFIAAKADIHATLKDSGVAERAFSNNSGTTIAEGAKSPLMAAVKQDYVGFVFGFIKMLVDVGMSLKAANKSGATALMLAAERGHPEIVEMLIVAGANPDWEDNNGNTAWGYAKGKYLTLAAMKKAVDEKYGVDARPK